MEKENKALNAYMKEISDTKLLSDKEEAELARRIQAGDSRAMDKLLKANLTFVVSLANQYRKRGLAIEDLISEGNIGMLKAAGKFSPDVHKRFGTAKGQHRERARAVGAHACAERAAGGAAFLWHRSGDTHNGRDRAGDGTEARARAPD